MAQTSQVHESRKSTKINAKAKHIASTSESVQETINPASNLTAREDSPGTPPQEILRLQHQYGNRAVQRLIRRTQNAKAQRQALIGQEGGAVSSDLQSQIDSARGGGQPLEKNAGTHIGGALGADLSGVRVHTDSKSDTLNRSLSAKAFTLGSDVFFSKGAYNPGTVSGKQLLAHELTHVVQQGTGKSNKVQAKLSVGPANDRYEQEADQTANKVMHWNNNPKVTPTAPYQTPSVATMTAQRSSATNGYLQRKYVVAKDDHAAKTYDPYKDNSITYDLAKVSKGDVLEVSDKPVKSKNTKLYKLHGTGWVKASWVTETMSPKLKAEKAKGGKLGKHAEAPENEKLGSVGEMLGTGGEYMFQHAEWSEHVKAQNEASDTTTTGDATTDTPTTDTPTTDTPTTDTPTTDSPTTDTPTTDGATTDETDTEPKEPWEKDEYAYGQDSLYTASDLVGLASGATKIWSTIKDKEMSTWDKALEIGIAGSDMGSKAADLGYRGKEMYDKAKDVTIGDTTDETTGAVTHHADEVLAGFGGAAGVLTTVTSGLKIIKTSTKMVKAVTSDDKYSKEEYAAMAGDILSNAAKLALGVVNTIKVIHYALGGGTMIMQAVPILEIIINGMRIIMDGYYLTQSAINWNKMTKERSKVKEDVVTKHLSRPSTPTPSDREQETKRLTKQVTKDAEWYRTEEGQIDNLSNHKQAQKVKAKEATIDDQSVNKRTFTRAQLLDYRLAKELRDINRKRVLRQSLHILSALTQIAGDAMVLGGITSGAGAGLKAGAAGAEASLPLFRAGKQFTRDKTAKHQAKDKGMLKNVSKTFVDPTKSTTAKLEMRRRLAGQILEMLSELEIKDGKLVKSGPNKAAVKRAKMHLKAVGVSSQELSRHAGDPDKQVKILIIALGKREFLD